MIVSSPRSRLVPGPTTIDSPERMRREPDGLRTIVPLVDLQVGRHDAGTLEPQLEVRARHERARRRHRDELRRSAEGAGDARGERPPADEHRAGHRTHRPAADAEGGRLRRRLVGRSGRRGRRVRRLRRRRRRCRGGRRRPGWPRSIRSGGPALRRRRRGDRGEVDGHGGRRRTGDQPGAERARRAPGEVGVGGRDRRRRRRRRHRPAARHQDGVGIRGRGIRPSRRRHRRPLHRRRPEARPGVEHLLGRLAEPAERCLRRRDP